MAIKGIKKVENVRINLTEYFDQETHVEIKVLNPLTLAQIQEKTVAGMRYNTKQKGKKMSIESMQQSIPAETQMDIRLLKLLRGVEDHNIETEKGDKAKWGKSLIQEIDEANPAILDKVVEEITFLTYPEDREEEETNPISAETKSGK